MSFLTQINNLFSKKQSEQLVGVSLQQESISFCSLPALHTIKSLNKKESKDVFFQQVNVQQNDFSAAIIETKASTRLVGKWHVVLNSQQAQIVQVDKPSVPEAEINSALKWQIKDNNLRYLTSLMHQMSYQWIRTKRTINLWVQSNNPSSLWRCQN